MARHMTEHPLVRVAGVMPRLESTAADPDLIDALSRLRVALDRYTFAVTTGTVTQDDHERMAEVFVDFAGVIRLSLGTRQIGESIGDG